MRGTTFDLVAGEWIDRAFDPMAALPEVTVRSDERAKIFSDQPALTPFGALGSRFTVVYQGTVYRVVR